MKTGKSEHTPGPWKMHETVEPIDTYNGWIIKEAVQPCFPICLVPQTRGGLHSPQEANAALIAAAPSMYSDLESIAAQLEQGVDPLQVAQQARAAISRARGNK